MRNFDFFPMYSTVAHHVKFPFIRDKEPGIWSPSLNFAILLPKKSGLVDVLWGPEHVIHQNMRALPPNGTNLISDKPKTKQIKPVSFDLICFVFDLTLKINY